MRAIYHRSFMTQNPNTFPESIGALVRRRPRPGAAEGSRRLIQDYYERDEDEEIDEEEETDEGEEEDPRGIDIGATQAPSGWRGGGGGGGGDDECNLCGGVGELLLCDGCDRAFHLRCVGLRSIPASDWYCQECEEGESAEEDEEEKGEEEEEEEQQWKQPGPSRPNWQAGIQAKPGLTRQAKPGLTGQAGNQAKPGLTGQAANRAGNQAEAGKQLSNQAQPKWAGSKRKPTWGGNVSRPGAKIANHRNVRALQ
eukprot:gene8624-34067_t